MCMWADITMKQEQYMSLQNNICCKPHGNGDDNGGFTAVRVCCCGDAHDGEFDGYNADNTAVKITIIA